MKKQKPISLPKISADAIAANIRKGMGRDKAFKVADHLSKSLKTLGTGDVNHEIFNSKEIAKSERIWTQVRNILANQKGFTVFELVFALAILGVVCLGIAELGVIAHFVAKFW